LLTVSIAALVLFPHSALAQEVEVTPNFSVTPTKNVTQWVYQMAVLTLILGAIVVLGILVSYLRFAPRFFGREERAPKPPPGARPPMLARPATRTPPAAATRPQVSASTATATATATAVAERPTAGPEGEPAVQADAVGEAEAAAPEPRPTAKTSEEVAAPAEQPAEAEVAAPAEQPAQAAAAAPAQAPAQAPAAGAASSLDQETYDRVLGEQLEKGVDKRVAEGRARAAAVVAARKKAQG
jgi:hypothetical protein